ncbi:MAG: hypothetical protein NTW94_03540 [Legionellales bacterium]|nr:hypothetical protein [Legionellales bacterium]
MDFLKKLCAILGISENDFHFDSHDREEELAAKLGMSASEHLNVGPGTVAQTYRGEFLPPKIANEVMIEKSQPSGTYIEAAALGEQFGCHVVVISPETNTPPICLYRAEEKEAPVVELNLNEKGFWIAHGKPCQQSNALLLAFAESLRTLVRPFLSEDVMIKNRTSAFAHDIHTHDEPIHIIKVTQIKIQQNKIAECVKTAPSPSKTAARFSAEKARIATLSPDEQKRIASDHADARKQASRPMSYQTGTILQYIWTDMTIKNRLKALCDEYEQYLNKTEGGGPINH